MNIYSNINDLINDVKNGLFDSIDFDRERNIDSVIKQEMIREMKDDNSIYRFHKFVNIPVIGNLLMMRRIKIYTAWILKIFPDERCIQIANDIKQDIIDHPLDYENAFSLLDNDSKSKYLSLLCMKLYGDFRSASHSHEYDEYNVGAMSPIEGKNNLLDAITEVGYDE